MGVIRMLVAVGAALLALALPAKAAAETRVALVIANSNYANQPPLPNATQDAVLVQNTLVKAGFDVIPVTNADFNAFNAALASFMSKAEGADIAMVYYAGHGIQSGGKNWLIPTNAILSRDRELMFQAVSLDNVMQAIGAAKVRIIVLDACRNNPFTGRMQRSVSVSRDVPIGLGKIEAPRGSMVMYSAAEGQTASDGPENGNSPFATAFTARLLEPGIDIRLIAGKIADDVFAATDDVQLPFYDTSLSGNPLYFIAPQPTAAELEMRSYTDANTFALTGNCGPMREHLTRFPTGVLAGAARAIAASCAPAAPLAQAPPVRTLPANFLDRLIARNLAPLSPADVNATALRIRVHPAALKAAIDTESRGSTGFGADGRLMVLFEPHIFSRLTQRRFDASNPDISYQSWGARQYPRTQADRWAQVRAAFLLDQQSALAATSYGMFQIMGMNYQRSGFETPSDYVYDVAQSNVNQLLSFETFIQSNNIVDELQRGDWEGFARVYNGPGQVERYGQLLRQNYTRACESGAFGACPATLTPPVTGAAPPTPAVQIPPLGEPAPLAPAGALVLGALLLLAAQRRRRAVALTR